LPEELQSGRVEAGADQAGSAQPLQSSDGSYDVESEYLRAGQRLRSDDGAVRVHADHAVHVPSELLTRRTQRVPRTQRAARNTEPREAAGPAGHRVDFYFVFRFLCGLCVCVLFSALVSLSGTPLQSP